MVAQGIACKIGKIKHRALPCYQSEEMEILIISFPRVEIEPATIAYYSRTLVVLRHNGLISFLYSF